MNRLRTLVLGAIVLGVIVLLWQTVGDRFGRFRLFFSTPSDILLYIVDHASSLAFDFAVTAIEAICGLLASAVIGMASLIAAMHSKRVLQYFRSASLVVQVIPLVVLAPLVSVVFGYGMTSKILLASLVSVFPFIAIVLSAYERVPDSVRNLLVVYQIPRNLAIRRVYLPHLLPEILSALQLCSTLSVLGAVIAEFSGASFGLGKNIFLASMRIEPELLMSSIALCAGLSFMLYFSIAGFRRVLTPWHFL